MDFVGTRGLHEPYQVQLNGYQTVCDGCFAPFPYQRPLDQRFGNVNEFRTDANSSYAGLQTAYTQQWRGLTLRGNYTFSHCLDEVSNGGLLAFSTQGLMSPLPGELSRQYASCDYDVRHNVSAYRVCTRSRFTPAIRSCVRCLEDGQISETAILHSGLPFSVLSQPYIANGNGVFQANGASTVQFNAPAYANRVPGVPVYRKNSVAGVTVAGTNNGSTRMPLSRSSIPATEHVREAIRRLTASSATLDVTLSAALITQTPTSTSPRTFPIKEHVTFRFDAQIFNASIIPTLRCRANRSRCAGDTRVPADSERSPAPSRRPRVCWASDWAATAPRA